MTQTQQFNLDAQQIKLYAAAPEMLAFIEKVAEWEFDDNRKSLHGMYLINRAQEKAFALIKKARD